MSTELRTVDRTVSLWAMLGVVRESVLPLAVIAVLVVAGMVAVVASLRAATLARTAEPADQRR